MGEDPGVRAPQKLKEDRFKEESTNSGFCFQKRLAMIFCNKEVPGDLGKKSLAWWEQNLASPGFIG